MGNSVRVRILEGLRGQGFSKLVMFVKALVTLPVLLAAWGAELYGSWLAITAVSSYVALSNFGLTNASAVSIMISAGEKKFDDARSVFNTSFTFILGILPILLLALGIIAFSTPVEAFLNIANFSNFDIFIVLACVALSVWMGMVRGLFSGVYTTTGNYGGPSHVQSLRNIVEISSTVTGVIFFGFGPIYAALCIVGSAALEVFIIVTLVYRAVPWARLSLFAFEKDVFKMLFRPSLGTFVLNIGLNSVAIQGPRIALSALIGPTAVVVYAVFATAMRLCDQIVAVIASTFQLEISRASGEGNIARTRQLVTLGTQASIVIFASVALGILLFGPFLFEIWTQGNTQFEYSLMSIFLVSCLAMQFGRMSQIYLIATNEVLNSAVALTAAAMVALAIGSALSATQLGIYGMAISMAVNEIFSSYLRIRASTNLMNMSKKNFICDIINFKYSYFIIKSKIV